MEKNNLQVFIDGKSKEEKINDGYKHRYNNYEHSKKGYDVSGYSTFYEAYLSDSNILAFKDGLSLKINYEGDKLLVTYRDGSKEEIPIIPPKDENKDWVIEGRDIKLYVKSYYVSNNIDGSLYKNMSCVVLTR